MQNQKTLTTANGNSVYGGPVSGSTGCTLVQDGPPIEKPARFDRERIPERTVRAGGAGAFGYFKVTNDLSKYTRARLFGKGSKERIVPVYDAAMRCLTDYVSHARPQLLRPEGERQALFLSTRGNRMSADALRTRFEKRAAEVGLDASYTPHAMRHTFATELLAGGADLRSVQELLGHESLSTTQVYTHLSVGRLKEAAYRAHPRS